MPTGSMINHALRYYFYLTFAHDDVAVVAIKVASSIILPAASAAPTMTITIDASKRHYRLRDADEDREEAIVTLRDSSLGHHRQNLGRLFTSLDRPAIFIIIASGLSRTVVSRTESHL